MSLNNNFIQTIYDSVTNEEENCHRFTFRFYPKSKKINFEHYRFDSQGVGREYRNVAKFNWISLTEFLSVIYDTYNIKDIGTISHVIYEAVEHKIDAGKSFYIEVSGNKTKVSILVWPDANSNSIDVVEKIYYL
jgi:hypothetical protein